MIEMQKQLLEEADWKNKELRAQLASLDLLCGEEIQKRRMLAEQLSQVKERSGISQVYTCYELVLSTGQDACQGD